MKKAPDDLRRLLNKITVLVVRFDNAGNMKMSKPCKHCITYMKFMGVKRVMYSTDDGTIVSEKVKDMDSNHVCAIRKMIRLA